VVKRANVYFDGGVSSRTVKFANGETKTLGIMLPGDYTFNTGKKELMEIQSGRVEVLLPGETAWRPYKGGEAFEVRANASFRIRVQELADYICSFLDA
jgi:hypothetical protein